MRLATLFTTTALVLALAAGQAAAQSAPFSSMVVFGDSLSDNGDLSLSLGLPRLRFTTNPGLVAVEDVARRLGLPLEPSVSGGGDYAYGGAGLIYDNLAGVPTVPDQVASYFSAHPQADPRALYSMWGGANDIFFHDAAIAAGGETLQSALPQVVAAAQLEGRLLDQLQAAGARTILVFNLPDIGVAPGGLPQDTTMAQAFNATLNAELKGRHGVVPVNMFLLLREAVANPAAAGFANVSAPACTVSVALLCTPQTLVQPNAGATYLFADDVHPSAAGHLATAEVVISELTAPGQMSLLAEAPLSLLRGHRAAVREQLDASPAGQGLSLFAVGRAGRLSLDGDWAAPSGRSDEDAITVGGLWRDGGPLALGVALTAGQNRFSLQGGLGGFDARELAVSAFGQYAWTNGAWASLQAGFGVTDYDDISRSFLVGSGVRTERSTSHGHDGSFELAAGRWLTAGGLRTGPFAAFSFDRVHVGDVAEVAGDSTSMWFAPQTRESSAARVGWSLRGRTNLGGFALEPLATLAYGHDFRADRRLVTAGLTTVNGDFSLPGYLPSRNWGEATLGLGAGFGRHVRAQLSYQGRYGDAGREHLGSLGVTYSF